MAIHHVTNPIIKVDGDTAHGQWKLWQPMVYTQNNAAFWYAAEYNDEFKNTDDGWKFTHLRLEAKMHSPYEDGFGKSPFSTS
jgi:hypothetical protein